VHHRLKTLIYLQTQGLKPGTYYPYIWAVYMGSVYQA